MADKHVYLDVRNYPTHDDGWTNTTASNNTTCSYKYTGGDDHAGGVTHLIGQGPAKITVNLIAAHQYQIAGVSFTGENVNESQLSAQPKDGRAHEIHNKNSRELTAHYNVSVKDTLNNNVTIPCDPQIVNRQPT